VLICWGMEVPAFVETLSGSVMGMVICWGNGPQGEIRLV